MDHITRRNSPPTGVDEMPSGISREEAIIISTLGILEGLIETGRIVGPKMLTRGGRKLFSKLQSSGFSPTPDEIEQAMQGITSWIANYDEK